MGSHKNKRPELLAPVFSSQIFFFFVAYLGAASPELTDLRFSKMAPRFFFGSYAGANSTVRNRGRELRGLESDMFLGDPHVLGWQEPLPKAAQCVETPPSCPGLDGNCESAGALLIIS